MDSANESKGRAHAGLIYFHNTQSWFLATGTRATPEPRAAHARAAQSQARIVIRSSPHHHPLLGVKVNPSSTLRQPLLRVKVGWKHLYRPFCHPVICRLNQAEIGKWSTTFEGYSHYTITWPSSCLQGESHQTITRPSAYILGDSLVTVWWYSRRALLHSDLCHLSPLEREM